MRKSKTMLMMVVATALVAALAAPAWAETLTYTSTFVNRFGNTVTVETTYVDGVLTAQTSTEVMPDGTVKLARAWEYYPNGAIKTYDEERWSPVSPTHLYQEYAENGQLVLQQGQMWLEGELVLVNLLTFDPLTGQLLTSEERNLITLADGTKVWEVTTETYVDGVLASSVTKLYPFDYDFEQALEERPGYGHGDANHIHTGPRSAGAQAGSNGGNGDGNGGAGAASGEARSGNGYGDRNHEHQGSGQNK